MNPNTSIVLHFSQFPIFGQLFWLVNSAYFGKLKKRKLYSNSINPEKHPYSLPRIFCRLSNSVRWTPSALFHISINFPFCCLAVLFGKMHLPLSSYVRAHTVWCMDIISGGYWLAQSFFFFFCRGAFTYHKF